MVPEGLIHDAVQDQLLTRSMEVDVSLLLRVITFHHGHGKLKIHGAVSKPPKSAERRSMLAFGQEEGCLAYSLMEQLPISKSAVA